MEMDMDMDTDMKKNMGMVMDTDTDTDTDMDMDMEMKIIMDLMRKNNVFIEVQPFHSKMTSIMSNRKVLKLFKHTCLIIGVYCPKSFISQFFGHLIYLKK